MTAASEVKPFGARWLRRRLTSSVSRVLNWWRLRGHPGHHRRVAASRRLLTTLRAFSGEGVAPRAFAYLRTVDPLLYEETVMSALEDGGAIVQRNLRYTGDGGVDGRCLLPGHGVRPFAVQCKRYGSTVAPKHVADFCRVIDGKRFAGGLLVHCGRTGPLSYSALKGEAVHLVSGDSMLDLLLNGRLPKVGGALPCGPTMNPSPRPRLHLNHNGRCPATSAPQVEPTSQSACSENQQPPVFLSF